MEVRGTLNADGSITATSIKVEDIGAGRTPNFLLQPGDIVFVPRRAIATLQEVFSIIGPALGAIESIYIIDNFRRN